ncbi:MAG: 30S ribosomal protein S6 [Verrucomicrobia bacterium]|nr:30S ribosomal protein S6 [Verrucomicrobiota bacterium]
MSTYTLKLIFPSRLEEGQLEKALDRIGEDLKKLGGEINDKKVIGRRAFARPMQKQYEGVYVDLQVTLSPDQVSALNARFKLNQDIFRVQILTRDEAAEAYFAQAANRESRTADTAEARSNG